MSMFRNALPSQLSADDWSALLRAITMCVLAVMLCLALCISLFFKNYVEPVAETTVLSLATFVLGYLAGKRPTIGQPPDTTTVTTETKPPTESEIKP